MPSYHDDIPEERKATARSKAQSYLRGIGKGAMLNEESAAGVHILTRTEAPSDEDMARLEKELKRATKTPLADSYTKGYNRQLTPQQQVFLDQLLKGDTMIHAYQVAYPNQTSSYRTKHDAAYHLMQHPVITAALQKADRERSTKVKMDASAIREYVIERLLHESVNAFTDGTRVRALELLGKVAEVGMFVNRSETTTITVPPSELQATLLAKLKLFFEQAQNHAQPLATITDRRQGVTIEQAQTEQSEVSATVRQSPKSEDKGAIDAAPAADTETPPAP